MKHEGVTFQLAPPNLHFTNADERAIQSFKDHLVAGLSSCDPKFPLHLWDWLLPQETLTLNMLRPSRINLRLSDDAHLNGIFDFNHTPLAPPGTKVLVFESPTNRWIWDPHGFNSWYIGSAPDHYWCYRVSIPKTHAKRTAKTIHFYRTTAQSQKYPRSLPIFKPLATWLMHYSICTLALPYLQKIGDVHMDSICHLSTIFDQSAPSLNPNPAPSLRVLLADPMTTMQLPVTSLLPPPKVTPVTSPVPHTRVPPRALRPHTQPPVTSPVPSPKVPWRASLPRAQPHVIEPDHEIRRCRGWNCATSLCNLVAPTYPGLAKRNPRYIASALKYKPTIPVISPHRSARHVTSNRLLLAAEALRCAPSANSVIE